MTYECCEAAYEKEFDRKSARKELSDYRKGGPKKNTLRLIEAIKDHNILDASLLDIGGGIGAIAVELIKQGIGQVTAIDYSSGYMDVAKELSESENLSDQISYLHGDYVSLSDEIRNADIVTLDKSICCYPDYAAFVGKSVVKANRYYGIIIPRDTWWVKTGHAIGRFFSRMIGSKFRSFIHPVESIERIILESHFDRVYMEFQREWMI